MSEKLDKVEEVVKTEVRNTAYVKASDWLGKHNFFSRAIIVAVIAVLIYSFVTGNVALAEIAGWLVIAIFVLVSVGINSLKIVLDAIVKIKGK